MFYKSFTESVLTFSNIAWYGNLNTRDKNHLSSIVKVTGQVIGVPQTPPTVIFDQQEGQVHIGQYSLRPCPPVVDLEYHGRSAIGVKTPSYPVQ